MFASNKIRTISARVVATVKHGSGRPGTQSAAERQEQKRTIACRNILLFPFDIHSTPMYK